MDLDDTKHGIETIEDEESDESFPASDPPSWSGMHIGAPCPADSEEESAPREPSADAEPEQGER